MTSENTRRDFLKLSGVVAGGSLVAGALLREQAAKAAPLSDAASLPDLAAPSAASPWDAVPIILARIQPPTFPAVDFDITKYGAVGDGKKDCTAAFKAAVAACNAAGGGRVVVPSGTFKTGAIHLLSNVNLHVAAGATIKFSSSADDFLPMVFTRWQGIECYNYSPFIYAYEKTNVAITGKGTIDGNAQAGPWFGMDGKRDPDWQTLQKQAVDNVPIANRKFGKGHNLKPNMIQLYKCKNILIEGVSIRNPAMWTVHPVLSENVTIRNISVYSRGAMVDGCDPEASKDVYIHGCKFDTGDDGTVIKAGRDIDGRRVGVASENIVVENNDYYGRWGALTVGSEMSGGVRNVFFQDCRIHSGSSYKAFHVVYIKTNKRRGGTVENINVRRITGGPVDRGVILVDMNYSLTGPGHGPISNPTVRNITVEQLKIDDSPYAIRIIGMKESPLTAFHVKDSTFTKIDVPKPQISNAKDVVFTNVLVNGKPI